MPAPTVLNPPDPLRSYFWFASLDRKNIRRLFPYEHSAGAPLSPHADYYAYPGAPSWTRVVRDEGSNSEFEPEPPPVLLPPSAPSAQSNYLIDDDITVDIDTTTLDLFATRSLRFVWLPRDHPSPTSLFIDDQTREYHRLTLPFLAWVRGICRIEHDAGRWPLSVDQTRAVARVWSYVCGREKIDDGNSEKVPAPTDTFPIG